MDQIIGVAIKIIICLLFALFSLRYKVLDVKGTAVAVLIGVIILFSTGIKWFLLLILFLFLGFLSTKFRFGYKERKGLHERGNGMRKARNVIANGMVPAVLAFLSLSFSSEKMAVPFVVAIATATSDTFASEIGVLSDDVYLITNLKRTETGANGGISLLGEGAAVLGAFVISISAFFLINMELKWFIFSIVMGFIGCHIDSLLGATLQGGDKGRESQLPSDAILTNSDVNLLSISIASLIAFIFAVLLF
ncbi:MAG: DUF92 domain-containing protein [Candidatus Thermoplasmatota archaeon]|nr:DUF92 domain-containing protein [Candidatus Thermoplasmatota archaeon]